MFFSKMTLRTDGVPVSELVRLGGEEGYRFHQQLWSIFTDPSVKERDFLYRREDQCGRPCFYAVSHREPHGNDRLWEIQTKLYAPKIRRGQRFAFALRANPVRTKKTGKNGKNARHDIVMEAKFRLREQASPCEEQISQVELVQSEGFKWLAARAERYGFEVADQEIRADGYRQHRLFKGRGHRAICFTTVDFNGLLTVIDPATFVHTMINGIGPAKGFGCGLLMVRRI